MSKICPKTSLNYSPNFYKKKRKPQNIKFIILHYTGMKNDKQSIKRLTDSNSSVSCHYYIDAYGKILSMVPDLYIAWHAGKSKWKNHNLLNKSSIGIEISNPGHNLGYKNFTNKQLSSVKKLISFLIKEYKIDLNNVLGHSDIAPLRKKDPGEKFPWRDLAKKKLCLWHSLNENQIKKFRNKKTDNLKQRIFFSNLTKIGYSISNSKKEKNLIINAFQRRFRQELISTKVDEECYLISKNLAST